MSAADKIDPTSAGGDLSPAATIALCRRAFGPHLRRLVVVNIATGAAAILEVVTFSLILFLAESIVGRTSAAAMEGLPSFPWLASLTIKQALLLAMAAIVGRVAVRLGEAYYSAGVAADFECQSRLRLAGAMLRADARRLSGESSSRLQVLLTKNILIAARTLFSVGSLVFAAVNFGVLLIAALVIDLPSALAIFGLTSVVFILLRPLSTSVQRRNRAQADLYTKFVDDVGQGFAMSRELQTFGVVEPFVMRLQSLVNRYHSLRTEQLFLTHIIGPLYQNAALLLLVAGMGIVYWTGFERIESLGLVVVLFVRTLSYGQQIQASLHAVHDGVPYLAEVVDAERRYVGRAVSDVGRRLPTIDTLAIDDVSFSYDNGTPVLRDVSFSVNQGELIGIVGPSGCGKTTLLQVLLRLHEPETGRLLVNGVAHEEFSRVDWQSRFAFVPQESLLFDETIAEAVRFFRDRVTDDGIRRAAKQANLDQEIAAFPLGYETRVGERGNNLSGGQRQRLSIARALADRPDVLVLDEPTAALDAESEAAVLRSLVDLKGEITTLVVSHRPATLQICDRVLVLRGGRVQAFDVPVKLTDSDYETCESAEGEAQVG